MTSSSGTLELYRHREVRKAARDFVEPLATDEVDEIYIVTAHGHSTIESSDRRAFVPPSSRLNANVYDSQPTMRIDSVSFNPGHKWRLYHGETLYRARIADQTFLERVSRRQETFAEGDHLRVRLRTREWTEDDKVQVEHEIIEVLEHLPAPRIAQAELDVPGDGQ